MHQLLAIFYIQLMERLNVLVNKGNGNDDEILFALFNVSLRETIQICMLNNH